MLNIVIFARFKEDNKVVYLKGRPRLSVHGFLSFWTKGIDDAMPFDNDEEANEMIEYINQQFSKIASDKFTSLELTQVYQRE